LRVESGGPLRYEEEIGAPPWLMAVLAVGLIAMAVAMVTPAFDDEAGWSLYWWYYPSMLFAGALLVLALFSFRRLRIQVSDTAVQFRFGLLRKSLPLGKIQGCEPKRYNWLPYGGWGVRFTLGGRRAWSMPGVPRGVEFTVAEGTKVRRYFVSSRSPELLAEAVRGR
jgi:hypothetical protein